MVLIDCQEKCNETYQFFHQFKKKDNNVKHCFFALVKNPITMANLNQKVDYPTKVIGGRGRILTKRKNGFHKDS